MRTGMRLPTPLGAGLRTPSPLLLDDEAQPSVSNPLDQMVDRQNNPNNEKLSLVPSSSQTHAFITTINNELAARKSRHNAASGSPVSLGQDNNDHDKGEGKQNSLASPRNHHNINAEATTCEIKNCNCKPCALGVDCTGVNCGIARSEAHQESDRDTVSVGETEPDPDHYFEEEWSESVRMEVEPNTELAAATPAPAPRVRKEKRKFASVVAAEDVDMLDSQGREGEGGVGFDTSTPAPGRSFRRELEHGNEGPVLSKVQMQEQFAKEIEELIDSATLQSQERPNKRRYTKKSSLGANRGQKSATSKKGKYEGLDLDNDEIAIAERFVEKARELRQQAETKRANDKVLQENEALKASLRAREWDDMQLGLDKFPPHCQRGWNGEHESVRRETIAEYERAVTKKWNKKPAKAQAEKAEKSKARMQKKLTPAGTRRDLLQAYKGYEKTNLEHHAMLDENLGRANAAVKAMSKRPWDVEKMQKEAREAAKKWAGVKEGQELDEDGVWVTEKGRFMPDWIEPRRSSKGAFGMDGADDSEPTPRKRNGMRVNSNGSNGSGKSNRSTEEERLVKNNLGPAFDAPTEDKRMRKAVRRF